jgi:hypothetical protein
MKKIIATFVCSLILLSGARAELFTFDLVNKEGAVWDNVSSGIYTNTGAQLTLRATMQAYLSGSVSTGSLLNSTASAFGINSPTSADDAATFDTNNGQEAIWVSFDRDVTIKSITVTSFSAGNVETGAYQVASGNSVNFTAGGTYNMDAVLTQGSFFKVTAINEGGGNGWSLSSFTVEAVPEPATALMLSFGGIAVWIVRRSSRV